MPFSWKQRRVIFERYKYRCAYCGTTDNLQAHDPTRQHQDDKDGLSLCDACHAKEHPKLSPELFTKHKWDSVWTNTTASEVARQIGVARPTILRRAQQLDVPFDCELWEHNKYRIANYNLLCKPEKGKQLEIKFPKPEGYIVGMLKSVLLNYQKEQGLNQAKMATLLGCHESYWSLIVRDKRPITEEVCARVIERIPSLGILGYEARQEITDERWRRMRAEAAR